MVHRLFVTALADLSVRPRHRHRRRAARCLGNLVLALSMVLGRSTFAQAPKTAAAPIHPAMVQVKEDPKLPRVLLFGDSITMGYTQRLRELLAKKANVQALVSQRVGFSLAA